METTRNKSKIVAAAGLGLVTALVALGILSGTLAKYTTAITGEETTARVAVFDVSVGDGKESFDLFATILDADGSPETDVKTAGAGEDAIIAPGTSGQLPLTLNNDSEVTVGYELMVTLSDTDIPIEFSQDGSKWVKDLTAAVASGRIEMDETDNEVLYWRWAFEGNDDTEDTRLGLEAQTTPETVTAEVKVVFTQID